MLNNMPTAYILAIGIYVFSLFMVIWFMRREERATWTRSIIAGILWPVTAILAVLYAGDRH